MLALMTQRQACTFIKEASSYNRIVLIIDRGTSGLHSSEGVLEIMWKLNSLSPLLLYALIAVEAEYRGSRALALALRDRKADGKREDRACAWNAQS
jgi:hypothetical protein